jgi:hypothetical protein
VWNTFSSENRRRACNLSGFGLVLLKVKMFVLAKNDKIATQHFARVSLYNATGI